MKLFDELFTGVSKCSLHPFGDISPIRRQPVSPAARVGFAFCHPPMARCIPFIDNSWIPVGTGISTSPVSSGGNSIRSSLSVNAYEACEERGWEHGGDHPTGFYVPLD